MKFTPTEIQEQSAGLTDVQSAFITPVLCLLIPVSIVMQWRTKNLILGAMYIEAIGWYIESLWFIDLLHLILAIH